MAEVLVLAEEIAARLAVKTGSGVLTDAVDVTVDFGVVGDLFAVVPQLLDEVTARKA